MTDKELMYSGKLYYSDDEEINAVKWRAQKLIELYNSADSDGGVRTEILKKLMNVSDVNFYITPPFHCDYGVFIEIGEGTFFNYDCIILDACKVKIGSHVLIGPRTCIYSVMHPIDMPVRREKYNIGKPVTIGDNVWFGGNVVVNPGVTIGDNSVIGSGSVVTKDIPANVIAAGNPCRVIRAITDEDKIYWEAQRDEYLKNKEVTNND